MVGLVPGNDLWIGRGKDKVESFVLTFLSEPLRKRLQKLGAVLPCFPFIEVSPRHGRLERLLWLG